MTVNVSRRGLGDVLAGVVALAILAGGIVVIAEDSDILGPLSKTTVTKESVAKAQRTHKKTVVVTHVQGGPTTRTRTAESAPRTPSQSREVTTTVQAGERTFLERVFGDVGVIVLQFGAVVLAAFLGAAIVQRIIVGDYAVEIGSFKLSQIANSSLAALESLRSELKKVDDARVEDAARTKDDLATAYKRMDLIERKLPN